MKYLKYLLIILLVPFIVLAEECDVSNITITSMEQNSIEGNTEVISDPTFEDRTINLDLKMYEVGDSISYDMTIKNDSEEDYMIDEDTFKTNSDYIEYTLKTKDNTNVVKANSTKEVSLIVTYKKEVDDSLLTNNKFNASNSLKLSLNTSEKEQPLDVITTDNIKESLDPQEVKNPITSVSSMMLISTILLTSIVILYILIKRKNRYTKYLLIILSMLLIPTVYAICTCNIEVESTIEIEKKPKLFDTIANIAKKDNSCVTKYEGEVTDEVGKTVPASNVYFNNCENQRNVIFGGFCWQVIRTTETGGVKMIYNGEPVNGKCERTRSNYKGIVQSNMTNQTLNTNYVYGKSFTYDTTNDTFTLTDTETATWSNSTYEDLIGKFTCKSSSDTCTTIYQINDYSSQTQAYASYYTIANTNYAQIGTSSFNARDKSPAMVGYMFNKVYNYKWRQHGLTENKYGSSFIYNDNTNLYTLSGTTQNISDLPTNYNQLNNTHYTCWNEIGECSMISYIYMTTSDTAYFISLEDGKNINDALIDMFSNDDVNRYNSSIKGIIDAWFAHNLADYTNYLEDAVYCNARNITDLSAFNPDGGSSLTNDSLSFKNYYVTTNLACQNITDQFSISNNKAKLTYPVALLQNEETSNINISSLMKTSKDYWELSPLRFFGNHAIVRNVSRVGEINNNGVSNAYGIRPVISLNVNNKILSGSGSEEEPWIIE